MKTARLAALLLIGCGANPCEPLPCTVQTSYPVGICRCGRDVCPVCLCDTPGCELSSGDGHFEYLQCDTLQVVTSSCPVDGAP